MKTRTRGFKRSLAWIFLFTLGLGFPLSSNQAQNASFRYRFMIEVSPRQIRATAGWLNAQGFDVAGVNFHSGRIEVLTSEEGIKEIQSRGWRGSVIAMPIAGALSTVLGLEGVDQRYYSPEKIEQKLKQLNAQYPQLTRVLEIGRSLQNRPIYAMVLSTTPNIEDLAFHQKPTVLFDAMHHAREVMTPEVVMDIAESLLAGSKWGVERARETLKTMNIVVIPMLNVDGNSIVWSSDSMWRKNARSEGSARFGVDINRNYPYRFGSCNGSSGSRGAQDYRGAAAASEPETRALISLADQIRPMGSISYHSYSELVLFPYGCNGDHSGERELIQKLGNEMAAKLPSDSKRGAFYRAGTAWDILYAVDGDSMSYLHAAFGAVAYVFEINQEFQPPYSLREPTILKHRAAWHHFLDQTQQHLLTVQVRDAQDRPLEAAMTIAQIPHVKGERNFGTNRAGNFFKMLYPGVYTIETRSRFGNKRASVQVNMTGQPQTVKITL